MREYEFRALSIRDRDVPDGTFVYFEPILGCGVSIDKSTLEQFTGFCDRYGEAIYEGDILRDKNGSISYVVWEDGGFAVKSQGSEAVDWEHGGWYSNTEVIGNIHQNPDLLK